MRITLYTIGGRGDTQPFVALAARLMQDGHRVTLAARPDFAGLAVDYGVDFAPLGLCWLLTISVPKSGRN
jgi:sterol 3beta-glucosyltransferase